MRAILMSVFLVGCLGGGGGGAFCTPAPGGAPCCDPPDMVCPMGSMLNRRGVDWVQIEECLTPDGEHVGPWRTYREDGTVEEYRDDFDGLRYACRGNSPWLESVSDPTRRCEVSRWDIDGNQAMPDDPCPEPNAGP